MARHAPITTLEGRKNVTFAVNALRSVLTDLQLSEEFFLTLYQEKCRENRQMNALSRCHNQAQTIKLLQAEIEELRKRLG